MEEEPKQIRGSSLLLAGRGMSAVINFAFQVLLVRFLATTDYGAISYVLAVVASSQSLSTLGINTAIPRFVPIYEENNDYDRITGTLLLSLATILGIFGVFAALLYGLPASYVDALIGDHQVVSLLYIMSALIPLQGADGILAGLYASIASPRTIFFRNHLLVPGIRLLVIFPLVIFRKPVTMIALGYVLVSAVVVAICAGMLVSILVQRGIWHRLHWTSPRLPIRELFSFSIPVLSSEFVSVAMTNTVAVFLLARFHSTSEVAIYRAVGPAATMNQAVIASFSILYTPLAARFLARNDHAGINRLYWNTTVWMGILSYPVFLLTFSLATPLTVVIYGSRYASSGAVLAILAVGYYFNTVLGLNTQTLRVYGNVKFILLVNCLTAAAGVAASVVFISRYGALGAAGAMTGTLLVRNFLTQAGFRRTPGMQAFGRQYVTYYAVLTAGAALLWIVVGVFHLRLIAGLSLAALIFVAVFMSAQDQLRVVENFPELMKIRLVRRALTMHALLSTHTSRYLVRAGEHLAAYRSK